MSRTEHDPELVERVARAMFVRSIRARAVLDLLAAEGRLCEPGEVERLRGCINGRHKHIGRHDADGWTTCECGDSRMQVANS